MSSLPNGTAGPAAPDVDAASRELEGAPPEAILRWAVQTFAGRNFALVSAFGPGSVVLIHLLAGIAPELPVVFVDTLHHFPETLEHVERVRARYALNLRVYRPADNLAEFEARHGPRLWERDLDLYQRVAKVESFRRATEPLDAWITGRRRDQSPERAGLAAVEGGERVRVNPLHAWSRARLWRFILDHRLPYNPLHDRGYPSVGDWPLTTPVGTGEDERSGRWRGAARTECGIHSAPAPVRALSLAARTWEAIRAHAAGEADVATGGLLIGTRTADGEGRVTRALHCPNHASPEDRGRRFEIDPRVVANVDRTTRARGEEILGVYQACAVGMPRPYGPAAAGTIWLSTEPLPHAWWSSAAAGVQPLRVRVVPDAPPARPACPD